MNIFFDIESNVFYTPADSQASRTQGIAGRKYNRKKDRYEFPPDFAPILQLYSDVNPVFDSMGEKVVAEIQREFQWWTAPVDYGKDPTCQGLLPHQYADQERFSSRGYGLNLSSRGTGKTKTSVVAAEVFPILVICPNIARTVWAEEFAQLGLESVCLEANNATERKKLESDPDVVIVGFPLVQKFSRLATYGNRKLSDEDKEPGILNGRFRTVIVDEAHRIANPDAKQSMATKALLYEVENRFLLTGTPITESPMSLWSLLNGIRPDLFSSSTAFRERYAEVRVGYSGYEEVVGIKPERKKEFTQLIRAYARRHQLEDVVQSMPPIMYSEVVCQMQPVQRRAYEQMESEYKYLIDDERIFAPNGGAQRSRLLQFAHGTPVVEDNQVAALTEPSAKVDALLAWLEDNTEPVVIFSDSRLLLNLVDKVLYEKKYKTALIAGGIRQAARDSAVKQFQAGEVDVILIQPQAGSEAITLTRANTVIFLGRPDSGKLGLQAEARVRRIGQLADHVRIIDFITEDTIETNKMMMLESKNSTSHELLGDKHKEGR